MKSRILDSSMITDFFNIDFDSKKICSIIKTETDKLLETLDIDSLNDWEIHFIFRYTNVPGLLIYTKGVSYKKEKYKEITVHVPIPTLDIVNWGVNIEQHIYKNKDHLNKLIKNFDLIEVEFSDFNSRSEYIIYCMNKSIKFCLKKGFSINGEKIKLDL